tara:strand:+ start:130 stop:738 length:609 start_codon:yes stop_codon:yes gene_type:complete
VKAVFSENFCDFEYLSSKEVEVVGVLPVESEEAISFAKKIAKNKKNLELEFTHSLNQDESLEDFFSKSLDTDDVLLITNPIIEVSKILGKLTDCKKVTIKLTSLRSPMCPIFHVDNIPCRFLVTLFGSGTEWISHDEIDWKIFQEKDLNKDPLKDSSKIKNFKTGEWSLLKGGSWQENFSGVVHRSPHKNEERLLLSIDPYL